MVYDPNEAQIDLKTFEGAPLTPAAAPRVLAASVETGTEQPLIEGVQSRSTDQLIRLVSDTPDAQLYYTITTGAPIAQPNPYDGSDTLLFNADQPITAAKFHGTTVTIRVIALKAQMYPSEIVERQVTIDYSQASTPVTSPTPGTYTSDTAITIAAQDPDATIWYTLSTDGTDPADPVPNSVGSVYSGPIPITGLLTPHKVKAIAQAPQRLDSLVSAVATYAESFGPSGLAIAGANQSSVTLSWDDRVGATAYEVWRDDGAGGAIVYFADSPTSTYADLGLATTTTYRYRVLAKNGYGSSSLSATVTGTTLDAGGGTSQADAGNSCRQIYTDGHSTTDGVFWVDPDGDGNTANAFQVYCDMNTDGGGWTLTYKIRNDVDQNTNPWWDLVMPGSGTSFSTTLAAPVQPSEGPTLATRDNYTALTGASEWRASTIDGATVVFDMVSSYFETGGRGLRCFASGTCTDADQTCSASITDGRVLTNTLGGPIGAGGSGHVCDVGWTGCAGCVDWSSVRINNNAGGSSTEAVRYAGDNSILLPTTYTAYWVR